MSDIYVSFLSKLRRRELSIEFSLRQKADVQEENQIRSIVLLREKESKGLHLMGLMTMEVNGRKQIGRVLFKELTMLMLALKPLIHEARESSFRNLGVSFHRQILFKAGRILRETS